MKFPLYRPDGGALDVLTLSFSLFNPPFICDLWRTRLFGLVFISFLFFSLLIAKKKQKTLWTLSFLCVWWALTFPFWLCTDVILCGLTTASVFNVCDIWTWCKVTRVCCVSGRRGDAALRRRTLRETWSGSRSRDLDSHLLPTFHKYLCVFFKGKPSGLNHLRLLTKQKGLWKQASTDDHRSLVGDRRRDDRTGTFLPAAAHSSFNTLPGSDPLRFTHTFKKSRRRRASRQYVCTVSGRSWNIWILLNIYNNSPVLENMS